MSRRPPQLPLQFFRWFCRRDLVTYVEGDLVELYNERLKASGLGAILLTLITVSYQAIRAARANPVNSLRSE